MTFGKRRGGGCRVFLFDYADGGAYAEETLRRNVSDLASIALRQRVLRDVATIDLNTDLFGSTLRLPVALGPVGISGMYARRGELQAARAARAAGIPICLSTVSICPIEDVAQASDNFWFQLYVIRDRAFMKDLIARAKAAGAKVLVFTVDMPVPGARYRDAIPACPDPTRRCAACCRQWASPVGRGMSGCMAGRTLWAPLGRARQDSGLNDYMGWLGANFDPSIQWRDLEWIRAEWDGPLVIKGILDPEDAREAAAIGANGIVVSNHGGRQLDGGACRAPAPYRRSPTRSVINSPCLPMAACATGSMSCACWRWARTRAAGSRLGLCARRTGRGRGSQAARTDHERDAGSR